MIQAGDRLPDAVVGDRAMSDVIGAEPALLVFFKESCGTCRMALPVFQQWSSQVRVVGISQDDAAATAGFFDEYDISMEVVHDAPDFAASTAFDIDAVPALFLIEDGEVTRSWLGWNAEKAAELTDHLTAVTGSSGELVGVDALPPFRPG
jgi:thiol-disulfide isomerase/thioredoxin